MDIKDRILVAIKDFVEKNGSVQSAIILPKVDYNALKAEAGSTNLGRFFLKCGFSFCCLPVFKSKRKSDAGIIIL